MTMRPINFLIPVFLIVAVFRADLVGGEVPALVVLDSGVGSVWLGHQEAELQGAFISEHQNKVQLKKGGGLINLMDPALAPEDRLGHGSHLCGILWSEQKALRNQPDPCLVMVKVGDKKFAAQKLLEGLGKVDEMAGSGVAVKLVLCAFNLERDDCSGDEFQAFELALKKLLDQGVVVVAAAGNRGQDLDALDERDRSLPAGLRHPNLVVVAASSREGLLTSRTNFGRKSIWLAAEGVQVESLWKAGERKKLSGSSQAAAIVAGQLFDKMIQDPVLKFEEVKKALEAKATRHPSLILATESGKFLKRTHVP